MIMNMISSSLASVLLFNLLALAAAVHGVKPVSKDVYSILLNFIHFQEVFVDFNQSVVSHFFSTNNIPTLGQIIVYCSTFWLYKSMTHIYSRLRFLELDTTLLSRLLLPTSDEQRVSTLW